MRKPDGRASWCGSTSSTRVYWASVAGYKAHEDPKRLIQGWNRLLDEHPGSEWAKRVEFIRMS